MTAPMEVVGLSALILISACLTIGARSRGAQRAVYVLKPLTTALIIVLALLAPAPHPPLYKVAVLVGLGFSLAGDVFLMLPKEQFVAGLVSFWLAHVAYIVAFITPNGVRVSVWPALAILIYVGVFLRQLWPHLGRLRGPVVAYFLVIVLMTWQAIERGVALGTNGAILAAIGAVLFLISDSALGFDRFVRPVPARDVIVLSTYWAAQWLIALSIR